MSVLFCFITFHGDFLLVLMNESFSVASPNLVGLVYQLPERLIVKMRS